jgi:hypothetical protein
MKKVCNRKDEETFAGTRGSDGVAPIPDLPALAPERGGSTYSSCSLSDPDAEIYRTVLSNFVCPSSS